MISLIDIFFTMLLVKIFFLTSQLMVVTNLI